MTMLNCTCGVYMSNLPAGCVALQEHAACVQGLHWQRAQRSFCASAVAVYGVVAAGLNLM